MQNVTLRADNAQNAKERLTAFFEVLHASKPALTGGKIPDDNFYFGN